METPLVQISQSGQDIGWGKLGSLMPDDREGAQITLHDVSARACFSWGDSFKRRGTCR